MGGKAVLEEETDFEGVGGGEVGDEEGVFDGEDLGELECISYVDRKSTRLNSSHWE